MSLDLLHEACRNPVTLARENRVLRRCLEDLQHAARVYLKASVCPMFKPDEIQDAKRAKERLLSLLDEDSDPLLFEEAK